MRGAGRPPAAEQPPTLIDYLPKDCCWLVDESHQDHSQVAGDGGGDRAQGDAGGVRVSARPPSAIDNPAAVVSAFEGKHQIVYVPATPGQFEWREKQTGGGSLRGTVIRTKRAALDPNILIKPSVA